MELDQKTSNKVMQNSINNYSAAIMNKNELQLPFLIEQLRQIIKEDHKNLPPNYKTDDEFLSIFIRVRDYNVERAFIGFKKSYKYWQSNLYLYKGLRPLTLNPIFKQQILYTLKSADPKTQSQVGIVDVSSWDTSKTPLQIAMTSVSFLIQESINTRKSNQINGSQLIIDFTGLNWSHLKEAMNPSELRRAVNGLQGGFPVRVIGIHLINHPSIFWIFYSVLHRLLSKKIRQRIHFHENLDSLHNHFDPNILPQELGGKLTKHEAMDHSLIETILNRNEYFERYYFDFDDNTIMESDTS